MKNTIQNKIPYVQNQKGASLVEFAIILPVFIIIIFGIIEFSLLLYNKGIITHAAREGARVGVVYDFGLNQEVNNRISESEIRSKVNEYIENKLISFSQTNPVINVNNICPNQTSSGQELTVRVNYTYSFLVLPNFIAALAGGTNLESEAVMVCE
jgi:Flp pilus assembly protein TadG